MRVNTGEEFGYVRTTIAERGLRTEDEVKSETSRGGVASISGGVGGQFSRLYHADGSKGTGTDPYSPPSPLICYGGAVWIPYGAVGTPFSYTFVPTGLPDPAFNFTVGPAIVMPPGDIAGLPPGLLLNNATGVLSGTPLVASNNKTYTFAVITTGSTYNCQTDYTVTIRCEGATSGDPPDPWSYAGDAIPAGNEFLVGYIVNRTLPGRRLDFTCSGGLYMLKGAGSTVNYFIRIYNPLDVLVAQGAGNSHVGGGPPSLCSPAGVPAGAAWYFMGQCVTFRIMAYIQSDCPISVGWTFNWH